MRYLGLGLADEHAQGGVTETQVEDGGGGVRAMGTSPRRESPGSGGLARPGEGGGGVPHLRSLSLGGWGLLRWGWGAPVQARGGGGGGFRRRWKWRW